MGYKSDYQKGHEKAPIERRMQNELKDKPKTLQII